MSLPVLLLVFNRPATTQRVLDALQQCDISQLYVAADGPRSDSKSDRKQCAQVRELVRDAASVWNVSAKMSQSNLGCGRAVSEGIDWFFSREESGVILEDDCIPGSNAFFSFTGSLLERYRENSRVMMISGNNFWGSDITFDDDYSFGRHPLIWGWATWRRAWAHYDFRMRSWPDQRRTPWLTSACRGYSDSARFWHSVFDAAFSGAIDTWDYQWVYCIWRQSGLVAVPNSNLVVNAGFQETSTHTRTPPLWAPLSADGHVTLPLKHPDNVVPNLRLERWLDERVYGVRARRRRRLFGGSRTALRRLSRWTG